MIARDDPPASAEDWRVEVELDDERHGYSLGERLRSLDLDDEARTRVGGRVLVTRSGSRLFLYTRTRGEAIESAEIVRQLVREERLTADIAVKRWHPDGRSWEDTSVPLPRTEAARAREREEREEQARRDVEAGASYEWHVHVHAPDRTQAQELEQWLRQRGEGVDRRWRFISAGALTEEHAAELAAAITEAFPKAGVEVQPNLDLPPPLFVLIRSLLD